MFSVKNDYIFRLHTYANSLNVQYMDMVTDQNIINKYEK